MSVGNAITSFDNPESAKVEKLNIKSIPAETSINVDDAIEYAKKQYFSLSMKEIHLPNTDLADVNVLEKKGEATEARNRKELTEEDIIRIKEEMGWSDEITDHIESMGQYEIYKNAGLHEELINGRKCLVKNIDLDYMDPKTGMTNRERLNHKPKPLSPIDAKTGEKIELHHMGQDFNGPFAELCENSEHGDGNHSILHKQNSESWRRDPELKAIYLNQRNAHWSARILQEE